MKRANRSTNAMDSPKTVRATASANEKQALPASVPVNITPKRILEGASTTTEVLSEILRRPSEPVRHWGINE